MAIAKNQNSITINYLLLCGIIAAPIFLLFVLIEGYIRNDYNALRYPLSSLSFLVNMPVCNLQILFYHEFF